MKSILALWVMCLLGASANVSKRETTGFGAGTSTTATPTALPTPSLAANVNSSKYDLSQHFCRLWRHASVLADGKIYVDGGNTFTPNGNTTFSNTPQDKIENGMIIDLSKNFTNQDTFPYTVIKKGPKVPTALIEQTLWYSKVTHKIYQLGGWFSFNSQTDLGFTPLTSLPYSAIWEFDIDAQTWGQSDFEYVNAGAKVERPGAAANCDVPNLNRSFLFEGYVQQRSDLEFVNYTKSSMFKYLEGMLQLDTNTAPPQLTNISVPNYIGPRMNGAMIHVPVGLSGVLVQIAGQVPQDPTPFAVPIVDANAKNTNIDNSFVDIYDIETGYWFRQQTFGGPDIPPGRSDICTVLVAAPDGSSYNIFVIAGIQTYDNVVAHEDMWVLSIPTFQWVQVHTRPGGVFGHTCHAVGENLVVVGGMQTDEKGGQVKNCSSHMPAEIFSLVELEYTGQYDFAGANRAAPVPADVVKLIGGTSAGGALKTQPLAWNDTYLQFIFNPALPRPSYTPTYTLANVTAPPSNNTSRPTPSPPQKNSNVGMIAGASVGGFVLLAILAIFLIIFFRRRSAKRCTALLAAADPHIPPPSELPSYQDTKANNPHAIEVSAYQEPLTFALYRMQNQPAEMGAYGEARDQWRPLSGESGVIGLGVGLGMGRGSPRISEVSRERFGSTVVGSASPGLTEGGRSPETGRLSRQSEVSRASY